MNDRKVTVEVRSVNSKQLDLFLKVPQMLRDKEAELRSMAAEAIVRGKAEVNVYEDAGHYVLEDAHERIVPSVRQFLDRTALERAA